MTTCGLDVLASLGAPEGRERHQYRGELVDWQHEDLTDYCRGLGISLPAELTGGHQVFVKQQPEGTKLYVPALALMQAFFLPRSDVFAAAFSSLNVDLFAYVGDRDGVPMVQMLSGPQFSAAFQRSGSADRHLKWLIGSRSARNCAQSVELQALQGRLGMTLPRGKFEVQFSGRREGMAFYAVKAHVTSVEVPEDDNISGQAEVFYLHRCQVGNLALSLPAVSPEMTDDEWGAVEHFVNSRTSVDSAMLTRMLKRLANGYWEHADPGVVRAGSVTLHKLTQGFFAGKRVDGVTRAVDALRAIREGVVTKAEGVVQPPKGAELATVGPPRGKDSPVQVFLKVDYEDGETEVVLRRIALVTHDSEVYAEWPSSMAQDVRYGIETVGIEVAQHCTLAIAKEVQEWLNALPSGLLMVHHTALDEFRLLQRLVALRPGKMRAEMEGVDVSLVQDEGGTAVWESRCRKALATRSASVAAALVEAKALMSFAEEMRAEIAALPRQVPIRKAMAEPAKGRPLTPWLQRALKRTATAQARLKFSDDLPESTSGFLEHP